MRLRPQSWKLLNLCKVRQLDGALLGHSLLQDQEKWSSAPVLQQKTTIPLCFRLASFHLLSLHICSVIQTDKLPNWVSLTNQTKNSSSYLHCIPVHLFCEALGIQTLCSWDVQIVLFIILLICLPCNKVEAILLTNFIHKPSCLLHLFLEWLLLLFFKWLCFCKNHCTLLLYLHFI